MTQLTLRTTLTGENVSLYGAIAELTPLSVEALGQTFVFSGAQSTGTISSLRLDNAGPLSAPWQVTVASQTPVYRVVDMEVVNQGSPRLVITDSGTQQIISYSIGTSGILSNPTVMADGLVAAVDVIEVIDTGAKTYIVTGAAHASGLVIYEWAGPTEMEVRTQVTNHTKIAAGNVSDMLSLTLNGKNFLVTGSSKDEAISTFLVDEDGTPRHTDTLTSKDGLWINGLDSLTTVTAHGDSYVVVGATNSSTLTLVRINDLGVMFKEDHRQDSLDTRFAQVDAVTAFTVGDRGFVVAGGSDDGLTLFEITPDRSFLVRDLLVNDLGDALDSISALSTVVLDDEVQVVAAGLPGLSLAVIDRAKIADGLIGDGTSESLIGTDKDDLIWGNGGNDTLSGGAGADVLCGGKGTDHLIGGEGADIFVFGQEDARDTIVDFELGTDTIDLSAWGRIYDVSALTIDDRWDGADVIYGSYTLRIATTDQVRLTEADLTNDSFLFLT